MSFTKLLTFLFIIFSIFAYQHAAAQSDPEKILEKNSSNSIDSPMHIPYSDYMMDGIKDTYGNKMFIYAFAAAGLLSNTNLDESLRRGYSKHVKSPFTDDVSRIVKNFGSGWYVIPLYPLAIASGKLLNNDGLYDWGVLTFNSTLYSCMGMLGTQFFLGASRPSHGNGSKWWKNDGTNGVSGHTWVSAIPFLTAAKFTDSSFKRKLLYGLSALTGLSRINDDAHYTSQVLLGYTWALISTNGFKVKHLNNNIGLSNKGITLGMSF